MVFIPYYYLAIKENGYADYQHFYGIIIMMYLRDKEHNPPHIHAFYGDQAASFYIADGEIY
jgi:hypothetical protein